MKKQILEFTPHQTAKVVAAVHFLIGLLIAVPVVIYGFIVTRQLETLALLLAPFVAWLYGYLWATVLSWIYNSVSRYVGGIEILISSVDEN